MDQFKIQCDSLAATDEFGQQLGRLLDAGMVVALDGTLGSGKTCLVQSVAVGLGIPRTEVVSPTFTICVPHEGRLRLLHVDAYRINHIEEMDELGLDEEVESGCVLMVEWAERVVDSLPPRDIEIKATPVSDSCRLFVLVAASEKGEKIISHLDSWHSSRRN